MAGLKVYGSKAARPESPIGGHFNFPVGPASGDAEIDGQRTRYGQQRLVIEAHVVAGVCVLRYDNEAGKGDHRHMGEVETEYAFTGAERLLTDFWNDVDRWRPG